MSSICYVGTYEKNEKGHFEVDFPIVLTGISASLVSSLMKSSNIDVFQDFTLCTTEDAHKPLFYTIDKEWMGTFDKENESYFEQGVALDDIPKENYPLVCDGVERNGTAYHFKADNVKQPNYSAFQELSTTKENIIKSIEQNPYFSNNHEDWMLEKLATIYNTLSTWIKNNKKIYWYYL